MYLAGVATLTVGLFWYAFYMPKSLDSGITVILRWLAYQRIYEQVDTAHSEIEAGKLEQAEARLDLFLKRHGKVQPDQINTHAVSDAHMALADISLAQGRAKAAVEMLDRIARQDPLNYHLWHLKGQACREAGDLAEAADAYRNAFKLALNHPQVVEGYLGVLSEQNAFEDILWVADHFQRAVRRGQPSAVVEVGVARPGAERRVLETAGIPVMHGNYFRHQKFVELSCGERRRIPIENELLHPCPSSSAPLYVQVLFKNVYDGLQINAFRYWTTDGREADYDLSSGNLHSYHRPHSGAEYYVEIRTELDIEGIDRCEVIYSCPEPKLSRDALAIIDKAQTNVHVTGVAR